MWEKKDNLRPVTHIPQRAAAHFLKMYQNHDGEQTCWSLLGADFLALAMKCLKSLTPDETNATQALAISLKLPKGENTRRYSLHLAQGIQRPNVRIWS